VLHITVVVFWQGTPPFESDETDEDIGAAAAGALSCRPAWNAASAVSTWVLKKPLWISDTQKLLVYYWYICKSM
jgi:hypothetical protein